MPANNTFKAGLEKGRGCGRALPRAPPSDALWAESERSQRDVPTELSRDLREDGKGLGSASREFIGSIHGEGLGKVGPQRNDRTAEEDLQCLPTPEACLEPGREVEDPQRQAACVRQQPDSQRRTLSLRWKLESRGSCNVLPVNAMKELQHKQLELVHDPKLLRVYKFKR